MHKRTATCKICAGVIEKTECRLVYAWSKIRPWGYIHMSCVVMLDSEFSENAHDLLRNAVDDGLFTDAALKADVGDIVVKLRKKWKES